MRVISRRTLREYWEQNPDAQGSLVAWHKEAELAEWDSPQAVKAQYRNASFPGGNCVVFNIKGNDYRLVVRINYPYRVVYVRWVGTHEEYDEIDVTEV